jgi:hypothetical protein
MSNKEIINKETGHGGNTAGTAKTQDRTGEQEAEMRGKLACKSNDITRTLMQGASKDIMPVSMKTGEREQSAAKRSCQVRKQGLLKFFGEGPKVQPPYTEGTPIATAKMQRTTKSGNSISKKKRDTSNGNKTIGRKKSKSDHEESQAEEVTNLEKMEKMPLKAKGTKDSTKKVKAKKDKGKSNTPDSGKKKATFAERVGKETVEEKEIEYKTCMVGFAVQVDKGKNTKGGFDTKLLEELAFMQTYIDKHASFHPIRQGKILKPIKGKGDMPKYQVAMRNYFCVPSARASDNVNADGGRVIKGSAIMGFANGICGFSQSSASTKQQGICG